MIRQWNFDELATCAQEIESDKIPWQVGAENPIPEEMAKSLRAWAQNLGFWSVVQWECHCRQCVERRTVTEASWNASCPRTSSIANT